MTGSKSSASRHEGSQQDSFKKRSPAEHLAALKRSRRLSRKNQLLQPGPPGRHKHKDRHHHERKHHRDYRQQREPPQGQGRQHAEKPPPITTVVSTTSGKQRAVISSDDVTLDTLHTLNTLNTLNTNQMSLMSVPYSVASGYSGGSCGLGMFNPFRAGSLHDRIRYQMEIACTEAYHGKGSRLTHLAATQKKLQADANSSNCATHSPLTFYGTLASLKERFRSEAVAETAEVEKEPLVEIIQKQLPTKEELERYAGQAKQSLLDTIKALEKARNQVGETLGPTIEKLREETENTCVQSDAWCRDNYVCLVATSTELHEQVANKANDYLGKDNQQDAPDDLSIVDDDIARTPTRDELSGQADQVLLSRLRNAATTFLEHYAALLSTVTPVAHKKEAKGLLELPDDAGNDPEDIRKGCKEREDEEKGDEARDVQVSQDSDDLPGPGRPSGESEESEDPPESSEQSEENPESSETLDLRDSVEVLEDPGLLDQSQRQPVDPDAGLPVLEPAPQEPEGVKPSDDVYVEASQASSKKSRSSGKNGQRSLAPLRSSLSDRQSARSGKKSLAKSDRSRGDREVVGALMPVTSVESGESDSPVGGEGNDRVEGISSFGDSCAQYPIDLVVSHDDSQSNRGQTENYYQEESARLERASASVWKKLKKLNKKKKMFAVSMLGDVINEIEGEDVDVPSRKSPLDDEASLATNLTNGTEDNPIVLLDEVAERPKADQRSSRKRRAVAPSDRDEKRLLGLEDQSQVSGLTGTGTTTTGATNKGEIKDDLQDLVVEYLGKIDKRNETGPNRLETAEQLLNNLKSHMHVRPESMQNVFLAMEPSEQTESSELSRDVRIMPMFGGRQSLIEQYQSVRRGLTAYDEPEIIQVIDDHHTINLVTTNSDFSPEVEDRPTSPSRRHKSKLLADPNRHARIEDQDPEQILTSRQKPKPQAGLNERTIIDITWDSAPGPANGYLQVGMEQRDDKQARHARGGFEPTQRQDSSAFLYQDSRYGNMDRGPRPPPTPETADVFRERKSPSFSSLPEASSDSKSVTSSILGKRIPGRSKSVSFNLPDDDEEGVATLRSNRSSSARSRGSNTTSAEVAAATARAVAARRELARLSQRQASLMSRCQQYSRK